LWQKAGQAREKAHRWVALNCLGNSAWASSDPEEPVMTWMNLFESASEPGTLYAAQGWENCRQIGEVLGSGVLGLE
jgi:hypothetical protein